MNCGKDKYELETGSKLREGEGRGVLIKPSLSLRRQVDVIEFYLKEKIFGDRCRTSRAAAREAKIPAASSSVSNKTYHSRLLCVFTC